METLICFGIFLVTTQVCLGAPDPEPLESLDIHLYLEEELAEPRSSHRDSNDHDQAYSNFTIEPRSSHRDSNDHDQAYANFTIEPRSSHRYTQVEKYPNIYSGFFRVGQDLQKGDLKCTNIKCNFKFRNNNPSLVQRCCSGSGSSGIPDDKSSGSGSSGIPDDKSITKLTSNSTQKPDSRTTPTKLYNQNQIMPCAELVCRFNSRRNLSPIIVICCSGEPSKSTVKTDVSPSTEAAATGTTSLRSSTTASTFTTVLLSNTFTTSTTTTDYPIIDDKYKYTKDWCTGRNYLVFHSKLRHFRSGNADNCDNIGVARGMGHNVLPDWQGPGWYRFTGQAGSRLADEQPGWGHCGTAAGGYLAGRHPKKRGMVKKRKVRFNGVNKEVFIEVINCGSYYIYNLPDAPYCDGAYCGID